MHRDKYGIIGQIQPDGSVEGGDSACWNGHWVYLNSANGSFPYVKIFEVGFGGYCRHPHPEQTYQGFGAYYKNPWNGCMSRDQLTGTLLALIKQQEHMAMLRLFLQHACRLWLFTYNTIPNGSNPKTAGWKLPDLTVMDFWATALRGFGKASWLLWPLLCVLDVHLLLSAIYDKYFDQKEPDCINFIGKLLVAREYVPTPVSWLATKFVNKANLLERLTAYWCTWRDNPEFLPAFDKKLTEVLG